MFIPGLGQVILKQWSENQASRTWESLIYWLKWQKLTFEISRFYGSSVLSHLTGSMEPSRQFKMYVLIEIIIIGSTNYLMKLNFNLQQN